MKKIFYLLLLTSLNLTKAFSQNKLKFKIPAPSQFILSSPIYSYQEAKHLTVDENLFTHEPDNKPLSFLSLFPIIKLKEITGKKTIVFYTTLSLSEISETVCRKVHPGLLKTYDEDLPELFKDAPFMLAAKCTISF